MAKLSLDVGNQGINHPVSSILIPLELLSLTVCHIHGNQIVPAQVHEDVYGHNEVVLLHVEVVPQLFLLTNQDVESLGLLELVLAETNDVVTQTCCLGDEHHVGLFESHEEFDHRVVGVGK